MSFLDTLKSLGLWQGQQPQAAQQNPYGLDPQAVSQARMQALGNIGGQILAMSQQMTPDQRARMMGQADWTGGYQTNLYNAAQMKLMGDASKRRDMETQRMEEARAMLAGKIKQMPQGRARDAAMYFFQAGDLGKAGEILFKTERRFNGMTGGYETVDYFGNPVGGNVSGVGAVAPQSAPVAAADPAMPPAEGGLPAPDAPVDQMTINWRRLTGDPNLSQQDALYIAQVATAEGNAAAGLKAYRDMKKQQIDQANTEQNQAQTTLNNDRGAADKLASDYAAATKGYQTVISAAERAANLATKPGVSPADKLAILYDYIKTLDPLGAVRDSDVELAQSIQPLMSRIETMYNSIQQGGTISDEAMYQIARTMAALGNDARGRMGRKEQEVRRMAAARQINPNMVFGNPVRGPAGPQPPIGYRLPRGAGQTPVPLELSPDEENDLSRYGG